MFKLKLSWCNNLLDPATDRSFRRTNVDVLINKYIKAEKLWERKTNNESVKALRGWKHRVEGVLSNLPVFQLVFLSLLLCLFFLQTTGMFLWMNSWCIPSFFLICFPDTFVAFNCIDCERLLLFSPPKNKKKNALVQQKKKHKKSTWVEKKKRVNAPWTAVFSLCIPTAQ